MRDLTTGKVARLAGVNLQTIRFYERKGLLPEPPRSEAGYRRFPSDAIRRVEFIKRAQELGFSLGEIKELLALRVRSGATCGDVRRQAEAKIRSVDEKIRSLRSMRRALERLATACSGAGPVGDCPILESLEGEANRR